MFNYDWRQAPPAPSGPPAQGPYIPQTIAPHPQQQGPQTASSAILAALAKMSGQWKAAPSQWGQGTALGTQKPPPGVIQPGFQAQYPQYSGGGTSTPMGKPQAQSNQSTFWGGGGTNSGGKGYTS